MNNFLKIFCTIWLMAFAVLSQAADFEITTSFEKTAFDGKRPKSSDSTNRSLIGKKLIKKGSKYSASDIFINDFGYEESIKISLNNLVYEAEAASTTQAYNSGLYAKYINKKEGLEISFKQVALLAKSRSDVMSECTNEYVKVRVDIHFKGSKKTVYGITDGGCP
jgi:hypothetical protein